MKVAIIVQNRAWGAQHAEKIQNEWQLPLDGIRMIPCREEGKEGCSKPPSAWSRDHFALVRKGDGWGILQPSEIPAYVENESNTLWNFIKGEGKERSRLNFQGGHIVTSQNRTYISANIRYLNPQFTPEEIEKIFEEETGKPVTTLPNINNWPHIDLYVTPVGENTVFVGDTSMGIGYMQAFASDPANADSLLVKDLEEGMGGGLNDPVYGRMLGVNGLIRISQVDGEKLDQIAAQLERQGLTVIRTPMLTGRLGKNPILTYNNVFQSGNDVFVPSFGIPDMDEAALEIYRKQGFNAIPIPAYRLARAAGVLHCSINPLEGYKTPDS